MLIILAALLAAPVAYLQLHSVMEGTDLMMAAFAGGDSEAALAN